MWGRERTRGRKVRSSETTSRSSSSPPQLTLVHSHHLCLHESLRQPPLFHQLPWRGAERGTISPQNFTSISGRPPRPRILISRQRLLLRIPSWTNSTGGDRISRAKKNDKDLKRYEKIVMYLDKLSKWSYQQSNFNLIKTSCRNSTLASTPSTSPSSPPSPGNTLSPIFAFFCCDNCSCLVWSSLIFKSNHPWYSLQFSSKQSYTIHKT